jgi:hypothetical protein
MGLVKSILIRLGLADLKSGSDPLAIFVLDDDERRHRFFARRFEGDNLAIAETVIGAKEMLSEGVFDAIFLDHDLLPEHYETDGSEDDENTGYAIALWLARNKNIQPSSMIVVHTRNSTGGMRMAEVMRDSGRAVEYVPFPMLDHTIRNLWRR